MATLLGRRCPSMARRGALMAARSWEAQRRGGVVMSSLGSSSWSSPSCRCGGYVAPGTAACPQCGSIVDKRLFDEQAQAEREERALRLKNLEFRVVSQPPARPSREATSPIAATMLRDLESKFEGLRLEAEKLLAAIQPIAAPQPAPAPAAERDAALVAQMKAWHLDPGLDLEESMDWLRGQSFGVDLWTSPKRSGGAMWRCRHRRDHGGGLRLEAETYDGTAWGAVAKAMVAGFEQGLIE